MKKWILLGAVFVMPFVLLTGCILFITGALGGSIGCSTEGSKNDTVVVGPNRVSLSLKNLTVNGVRMKSDQAAVAVRVAGVVDARAKKKGFTKRQRDRAVVIALITGSVESGLRNLHYGDRDSQGVFQQRPTAGWGTVAQVTNVTYATNGFLNGLFAVRDWDTINQGVAAQRVQISAFPDRYGKLIGEAERTLAAMHFGDSPDVTVSVDEMKCEDDGETAGITVADGKWTKPLRAGYRNAHNYGPRVHPVTGKVGFHNGDDLSVASGTPIYAASSGKVVKSEYLAAWGNVVVIDHGKYNTLYAHMSKVKAGIRVGTTVKGGQNIGYVGSTGYATGPHLHINVCTSVRLSLMGSGADGKGCVNPDKFFLAQGIRL